MCLDRVGPGSCVAARAQPLQSFGRRLSATGSSSSSTKGVNRVETGGWGQLTLGWQAVEELIWDAERDYAHFSLMQPTSRKHDVLRRVAAMELCTKFAMPARSVAMQRTQRWAKKCENATTPAR